MVMKRRRHRRSVIEPRIGDFVIELISGRSHVEQFVVRRYAEPLEADLSFTNRTAAADYALSESKSCECGAFLRTAEGWRDLHSTAA